ncbi:MAG: hypothetical protein M1818_001186 [Claussenomyces sp. TS43310]|nr:MAG: hypothetical protein M1818_001186 [Claussenomyces sp. TS43310]
MPRTNITSYHRISRPGNVTYTFSGNKTTIVIPAASPWTSGLHWHENHTEYLQVIRGTAQVQLDNVVRLYTSIDGIVTVPRFARHEWQRAGDEEAVVEEWTDPGDGQKEIFFRNINGVILDCTKSGPPNEFWLSWQLFVIFHKMDNYPVVWSVSSGLLSRTIEWVVTHLLLWLAATAGRLIGLESRYEEYTPIDLMQKKLR